MTKAITQEHKPLTPLQKRFVAAFITTNGDATKAVQAAGSSTKHPSSVGWQMLQKPHVRQAIRDAALETLNLPMMVKALKRVDHLVDHAQSEGVQLAAATDILDRASIKAQDIASVPFKGTIRIDFRSPTERRAAASDDGTQAENVSPTDRGGKSGNALSPTPPIHATEDVIDAEYEEL